MRDIARCSIWISAFLMIVFPFSPLRAADATEGPQIGLVLSGGGARGAAHIGVLRVLKREGIPIHCIAATSMGSLVGGLYAIGYSPDEIEHILGKQDWQNLFTDAPHRRLTPLIERSDTRYQGKVTFKGLNPELPSGLWSGQHLTETLDILTTRRMLDAEYDFDRLPVRFRAVATNIIDGKPYVFDKGSLTQALRASMAVPLLFTPLEHEGMLLTDGGLTNNLPADIARAMGADIVIAVDTTSPLLTEKELRSFVHIIDQSISLQMEDNVRRNRKHVSLLLTPDLEGYSGSDYVKIAQIIKQGEAAAEGCLDEMKRLTAGAAPRPISHPPRQSNPIIHSMSFEGLKAIPYSQLRAGMRLHPGDPVDASVIGSEISRLYATRLFESVSYHLRALGTDRYHLTIIVKEALLHTLGASLRYDNDFNFVALAEYTSRQLFHTSSKLTVSTRFGGLENHFASLRFVPPSLPFLYLEPKVEAYRLERLDIRQEEQVDKFMDKRESGQLTIGAVLSRQLEISGGYRYERARIIGGSEPKQMEDASIHAGLAFQLTWDTLDFAEFPRSGLRMKVQVNRQDDELGGDHDYTKWQAGYRQYLPVSEKSTIQMDFSAGYSEGVVPFYDLFYVGGFSFAEKSSRQFIGLRRDEFAVRHMAMIGARYRREIFARPLNLIKRGYLIGSYNGAFFSDQAKSPYDVHFFNGLGIGLAADTMIGPLHIQGGWGEGGRFNFYLSFGPSF